MLRTILCAIVLMTSVLFLVPDAAEAHTGHKILRKADNYVGRDYVYGGFDCSWYTKIVYRDFGVWLPDHPHRQYNMGWRPSQRKVGDLVFFKENGIPGPVTHVGFYAGNGYVLHASEWADKVTYTKIRYLDGYVGAKRYIRY